MLTFHDPDKGVAVHKAMIKELTDSTKKYWKAFEFARRGWELHIYFEWGPTDEEGKPEPINFESASALTEVQSQYSVGEVHYYLGALIEKNRDKELDVYALHELLHVLFSPYTQMAESMVEDMDSRPDVVATNVLARQEENFITMLEKLKFFYKIK
jgi:hypothetical protein